MLVHRKVAPSIRTSRWRGALPVRMNCLAVFSGCSGPGSNPGRAGNIVLCLRPRHFTRTVPHPSQTYKMGTGEFNAGVTLRWASVPSSGESLHATERRTKIMWHTMRLLSVPVDVTIIWRIICDLLLNRRTAAWELHVLCNNETNKNDNDVIYVSVV